MTEWHPATDPLDDLFPPDHVAEAGQMIAQPDPPARPPVDPARLYAANAAAAAWFQTMLADPRATAARRYAATRGLTGATLAAWGLGYAPREGLAGALESQGFTVAELLAAGLLTQRDPTQPPRSYFRQRLMIPIRRPGGQIAGFGGRAIGPAEPKYLNTPSTPVYDKGTLLYGWDRAATTIHATGTAVLVEGYLDVLTAQQAGHGHIVATCGTTLTPAHVALLHRAARRVILAFDADAAGAAAWQKAARVLLDSAPRRMVPVCTARGTLYHWRLTLDVRVLILPPGLDPDAWLRRDPAAFTAGLESAVPVVDHVVTTVLESADTSTGYGKSDAVAAAAPWLQRLGDPVARGKAEQRLAVGLHLPAAAVAASVAQWREPVRKGTRL